MNELLAPANVHSKTKTEVGPRWSQNRQTVQTRHGDYKVIEHGPLDFTLSAPPLVVEHGLGRHIGSRKSIIPALKEHLPTTKIYEIEPVQQARNHRLSILGQIAAMNKLKIDEHDEVGMSFGGYESVAKAAEMGARVLHLTTVAAIGLGRPHLKGIMRSELDDDRHDRKSRLIGMGHMAGDTALWLAGCIGHPRSTLAQMSIIFDRRTELDELIGNLHRETRLTMMAGALDPAAPPDPTARLVDAHKQNAGNDMAQFVLVRGIAHGITSEGQTISRVVAATNRHEQIASVMDVIRPVTLFQGTLEERPIVPIFSGLDGLAPAS